MKRLLITDLDNTLYNFIDYFGPSFRGMVHALANKTKLKENEIIQDFKKVYALRGSLEYAFAIQELDLTQDMSEEDVFKLIQLAKAVFSRVRQKNLVPYSGVRDCLKWLRKEEVVIVGLSNAPIYNAEIRLKQLKLDGYFDGLAAWQGPDMPISKYTQDVMHNIDSPLYRSNISKIWKIQLGNLKPSTYAFDLIQQHFGIEKRNVWVIGDSIYNDVEPGISLGFNGIWAQYGTIHDKKNLATALEVTNWDKSKIERSFYKEYSKPKYCIQSFDELKAILGSLQLKLL
jgi:FMN phosphatase YigB (HAD superfamily)